MKIQLEQLDLLEPWPQLALRDGFHAIRLMVRIGEAPIGQVHFRPVRKRLVTHCRLRRQIARLHADALLKHLTHAALLAGPEALGWFLPLAWPDADLARADRQTIRHYVEQNILLPTGLPSPLRDWVLRSLCAVSPTPPVTVALCTRGHAPALEGAISRLQQLDYPDFEILVIDNSGDPVPTHEIVQRHSADRVPVAYVRCVSQGTSRARNAAIAHARTTWIAFIDDDCRPEKHWLREMMRSACDPDCRAVTGLVLPSHLDNAAEIVCDWRDSIGVDLFASRVITRDQTSFSRGPRAASSRAPVNRIPDQTWPPSAGASLLIHRSFAQSIGGFNIDLGSSDRSGGGCEDAEFLDRILRKGGSVHHAPSAIVHHGRSRTAKSLRQHVYNRAGGRAAILARSAVVHADVSALPNLLFTIPHELLQRMMAGLRGRSPYPFSLSLLELRATVAGPVHYAWAKFERLIHHQRRLPVVPSATIVSTRPVRQPPAPIKPRLAA